MISYTPEFLRSVGLDPEGLTFGRQFPPYDPKLVPLARELRTYGTKSEAYLWQILKNGNTGYKFTRQRPILHYIADFYCNELQVVVEIDGNSHQGDEAVNNDRRRDDHMRRLGLHIVRLDNNAVMCNPIASAQRIFSMLDVPMPESLNFMATGRERLWPQGKISL